MRCNNTKIINYKIVSINEEHPSKYPMILIEKDNSMDNKNEYKIIVKKNCPIGCYLLEVEMEIKMENEVEIYLMEIIYENNEFLQWEYYRNK